MNSLKNETMDLKKQILVALGLDKEETKLGFQAKSDDGTIFVSTAEELEAGVDISVLTEDGTTIPVPAGTYKLDTGESFRVEDEGIVAEVLVSETEEEETEEETEEVKAADEGNYVTIEDWRAMEERIKNLEDGIADLKESKEGGDTEMADEEDTVEVVEEVVEAVQASVEEIAAAIDEATPDAVTPELAQQAAEIAVEVLEEKAEEVVAEADGTELSNLKAENEKLKTELAESPAEAPINTNKFSSERATPTKQDFKRMTKQEKFLYELYK